MKHYLVVAALVLLCVSNGVSQSSGGDTPANCRGMLTATLASGRSHGDLSRCGEALIPGLLVALGDSRHHAGQDHRWFASVYRYGSLTRDDRVLQASLELAVDRSASSSSRSTGLMIAVAQIRSGYFPADFGSFEALLAGRVPSTCRWSAITDSEYWVSNPLPTGYVAQIHRVADQMSDEEDRPAMQRLGRCVELLLRAVDHPTGTSAGRVRAQAVCDRRFNVSNPGNLSLELHWLVEGASESGDITVQPRSERVISTAERGPLVVSWEGTVVARSANVETACPA